MFFNLILIFGILFSFQTQSMAIVDDDSTFSFGFRQKPRKETDPSFCCLFTSCFKWGTDPQESVEKPEQLQEPKQKRAAVTFAIVPINTDTAIPEMSREESFEERSFSEDKSDNSQDSNQFANFMVPVSQVNLFTKLVNSEDDEFFDYDYNNNDYLTKTANELLVGNLRSCNIGNCGKFCFLSAAPTYEVPADTKWFAKIINGAVIEFEAALYLCNEEDSFDEVESQEEFPVAFKYRPKTYKILLIPSGEIS